MSKNSQDCLHDKISNIFCQKQNKTNIHLYVDTSGSIEFESRQYLNIVRKFIAIAIEERVTLTINNFSHTLGEPHQIISENWNIDESYNKALEIQPEFGGTDYTQIWDYIKSDENRNNELSIIITDFKYFPLDDYNNHPENLYYVSIESEDSIDEEDLESWINYFCCHMQPIEPNINERIWR